MNAGRKDCDGRLVAAAIWLDRRQRLPKQFWIIFDRPHFALLKQLRKQLHHRLAVFKHVGNARRSAGIVLKHIELVFRRADNIDANNVRINIARRAKPDHFGNEGLIVVDQLSWNAARPDDFLPVINVI